MAYTDDTVRPGKLNIVLIPGSFPNITPDEDGLELVRRHARAGTPSLGCLLGLLCSELEWGLRREEGDRAEDSYPGA
jgi:hypothetical protein